MNQIRNINLLYKRPEKKSGIAPATTEARIESYVFMQVPQWLSELT